MKTFLRLFLCQLLMALLAMCSSASRQPLIRGGTGAHIKRPALLGSKGYEIRGPATSLADTAVIEFQNLPLGGPSNRYIIELRFLAGKDLKSIVLPEGVDPRIEVEIESAKAPIHWRGRLSRWIQTGYRDQNDMFYYPDPGRIFPRGYLESSSTPTRLRVRILGPTGNAKAYSLRLKTGGTK